MDNNLTKAVDLRLELLHAKVNKYIPGMTAYPFYALGETLLSQGEVEVKIPLTFTK